jgi:hypothetical protein
MSEGLAVGAVDSLRMNFLHELAEVVPFIIKSLGFQDDGEFSGGDLIVARQYGSDFGLIEGLLLVGDAGHGMERLGSLKRRLYLSITYAKKGGSREPAHEHV